MSGGDCMTALREKVHNEIDLIPEENMQQVHDIIITFVGSDAKDRKKHSAKGALKKYADPSKWSDEEGAFERALSQCH